MNLKNYIDNIENLDRQEITKLIEGFDTDLLEYTREKARKLTENVFQKKIYFRGLIEFSNRCKNNCFYCGIRCCNKNIKRYRMPAQEILDAAKHGYRYGCRTFVLQSGEDAYFKDDILVDIITKIKSEFPDCAITLSVGEKPYKSYKLFFDAGADRYLLRHESANCELYNKIHPREMSWETRLNCLENLRDIGFQTGCGMMIGVPGQTAKHLADDIVFIKKFKPEMVGVGPFMPQSNTPYSKKPAGCVNTTLFVISLIRLLLPNAMIPSTTALASANTDGCIQGILSGANVIMPNITPHVYRENYALYDSKNNLDDDIKHVLQTTNNKLLEYGYSTVVSRGDYKDS